MDSYFKNYEQSKIPYPYGPFDDNGVPLFDPKKIKLEGDLSYHPISIIQYGLANYNVWKDNGGEKNKTKFLLCADWLCQEEHITNDNVILYYYHFDLKNPKVKSPWYSGMAQGQALSLLARAFFVSKDQKYVMAGNKILNGFKADIKDGGCLSVLKGNSFIQEIAQKPYLYILNGALYGMIGIAEFNKNVSEQSPFDLNDLLSGLKELLPKFNIGFWSKYSLGMRFNLADKYYHQVHFQQLLFLGNILNDEKLKSFGDLFKKQFDKNVGWISPILFISLSINRAIRLLGAGKLLFKY